ncbi:MAG: hypothetical protein KKA19_08460 [Candidatus Margulisbacteria bacterium]|nr:hypothetical protein [Candidatus Margulisiibacteriota bacterium]
MTSNQTINNIKKVIAISEKAVKDCIPERSVNNELKIFLESLSDIEAERILEAYYCGKQGGLAGWDLNKVLFSDNSSFGVKGKDTAITHFVETKSAARNRIRCLKDFLTLCEQAGIK